MASLQNRRCTHIFLLGYLLFLTSLALPALKIMNTMLDGSQCAFMTMAAISEFYKGGDSLYLASIGIGNVFMFASPLCLRLRRLSLLKMALLLAGIYVLRVASVFLSETHLMIAYYFWLAASILIFVALNCRLKSKEMAFGKGLKVLHYFGR